MSDYTMSQIVGLIDISCWLPTETTNALRYTKLNKVREMFYNSTMNGGWNGTDVGIALSVYTAPDYPDGKPGPQYITLPRGIENIIGLYDKTGIVDISNEWFDYLHSAPGTLSGSKRITDLGDGFVGITDIPTTGAQIQITTTVSEPGSQSIIFYGTDANGIEIASQVAIPATVGSAQTSLSFYSITEVVVPETAGDIIVNLYDGTDYTFFARYQPGEESPNYRRYRLEYRERDSTVHAKCNRKFILLTSDNDPLDICNINALEHGLRSYKWFQNNDTQHGGASLSIALNLLNGELVRSQGETSLGSVMIDPLLALGGDNLV